MGTSLKTTLAAGALVAYVLVGYERASAADAWGGSYCLGYGEGGVDCGFTSLDQCRASASGTNAGCFAARRTEVQSPGTAGAGIPIQREMSRSEPVAKRGHGSQRRSSPKPRS